MRLDIGCCVWPVGRHIMSGCYLALYQPVFLSSSYPLISYFVAAAPKVMISPRWSPSSSSLELTLVCSAPAHPPAQILWYKSPHTLLTTAPGLTLGSSDQDTVWLQIPGVTSAALGSYTCQAINTIGQDSDMYYLSGRYHQLYMPGKTLSNYREI